MKTLLALLLFCVSATAQNLHGTYLAVWEREPCPDPGPWKLKALFPSAEEGSVSCGCAP